MKAKSIKKRKAQSPWHLREREPESDRQMVMAKLARVIGRGRDPIYHGTRHPAEVLRTGKLKPSNDGGVYFSRSPEESARCAYLWGNKIDGYVPALLVFSRSSLSQAYRLKPSREVEYNDEREEHVWDRIVSFRRHLLGVVREEDVAKILGPRKFWYRDEIDALSKKERRIYYSEQDNALREVLAGRAIVRDLIVRERSMQTDLTGLSYMPKAPRSDRSLEQRYIRPVDLQI